MDYVLIAFFSQLAIFYTLIVSYEFYQRQKMASLKQAPIPQPVKEEFYWRKAG